VIHQLKCHPEPFEQTRLGLKTHEFRKNDRNFQVGHIIILYLWNPETNEYCGRKLVRLVTYVGTGFGIPDGHVCLSIMRTDVADDSENSQPAANAWR